MIFQVYYSEQTVRVPIKTIEGKCEVRRKQDFLSLESSNVFEHIFFCEYLYDPENGSLKLVGSSLCPKYIVVMIQNQLDKKGEVFVLLTAFSSFNVYNRCLVILN